MHIIKADTNTENLGALLQEGAVICMDKPLDWTSFDAVNFIKYRARRLSGNPKIKVGHAGTLDPKATGLLLIGTGSGTKIMETLQAMPKEYTGTFKLGATTPCYDTERPEDAWFPTDHISPELLEQARLSFVGPQMQIPPVFSAIKVGGKALYESAHQGKEVEAPKARAIEIYEFEITRIEMPFIDFKVRCSKGTYIRSLAYDFGKAVQSGAYLTALRRTAIGDYTVTGAMTTEHEVWKNA